MRLVILCSVLFALGAMSSCNSTSQNQGSKSSESDSVVTQTPEINKAPIDSVVLNDDGRIWKVEGHFYQSVIDNKLNFDVYEPIPLRDAVRKAMDLHLIPSLYDEDVFSLLYAYFLKQRPDAKKYSKQRKHLLELYRAVNSLASAANLGGTAFSHEWASIAGQVEYELYLKKGNSDDMRVSSTFAKDKAEFIKLLSEKATRKCYESNMEFDEAFRMKRVNEMKKDLKSFARLISNDFYLASVKKWMDENCKFCFEK
jgi:hypothetical protein